MYRIDRDRNKGGGIVIYIHESLPYTPLPIPLDDNTTESQSIKIGDLTIVNAYIPPTTSCPLNYTPNYESLFPEGDALVLGDFNAHDTLWHSSLEDNRGSDLSDFITDSNFGVLNEDMPTRLPSNGQPTSPDISFASLSLLPVIEWTTVKSLGSDHLPIVIEITSKIKSIKSENRTYINFNKADWNKFVNTTEARFQQLESPTDIYKAEKIFRRIINKTSKQCIPGGRIKDVIPEMPTETVRMIKRRDELRNINPDSPDIARLNVEIYQSIKEYKTKKWRDTMNDISKSCSTKLFKLIKNLNKTKDKPNLAIKFKGKYISNPSKISNYFNKQYSSVIRHSSTKDKRKITKDIRKNELNDAPQFNPAETAEAIKKCKSSKAKGPDNITNLHLKHIGPHGIKFLTDIFNLSVKYSVMPAIWKSSTIIPLLKPGKDPADSKSYRPVSLLCPAVKILERLLLPTLNEHLPIPDFQHGFRKSHSTITALNDFNQHVCNGMNQKRPPDRTILLQIDLSKAFDMVSHNKLLKDLNNTTLPDAVKRWFNCYLRGRQSRVSFRDRLSNSKNIYTGVPQGAVTSPILFNFYLTNLPRPPKGIFLVQYADDISIYTTGKDLKSMTDNINNYVNHVIEFLEERELVVSPEKSTVTLFTSDNHQFNYHPEVKIKGRQVPLEKTPKLLGVIFDTMYTFAAHAKNTIKQVKKKVNILSCLAGTDWGADKETLVMSYKSIGRSVLEYGNPIWSPILADNHWKNLQVVQNKALKIATGCHRITSMDHLHQETKVLPVKDHCQMVTKQFLLGCHAPNHPGNKHIDAIRPPRNLKPTLYQHNQEVTNLLPVNTKQELKRGIKSIHTKSVRDSINNLKVNRVLQTKPPEIDQSETELNRKTRSTLAQLRSGFCKHLNSFKHRCDENIPDTCPDCNESPHDVQHLFNCTAKPTELTPLDLWTQPILASEFLNLPDDGIT